MNSPLLWKMGDGVALISGSRVVSIPEERFAKV
jgi:hypothetical protein